MPTMTRPHPAAARRRRPARAGRAAAGRLRPSIRRRHEEPSGLKGLAAKASSAMPSLGGGSKGSSSKRKPIGMAMLAGAAGLAIKNRDKLRGMLGRHRDEGAAPAGDPAVPSGHAAPAGDPAVPSRHADAAPPSTGIDPGMR